MKVKLLCVVWLCLILFQMCEIRAAWSNKADLEKYLNSVWVVKPDVARSVLQQESSWCRNMISHAWACGCMQVVPRYVWAEFSECNVDCKELINNYDLNGHCYSKYQNLLNDRFLPGELKKAWCTNNDISRLKSEDNWEKLIVWAYEKWAHGYVTNVMNWGCDFVPSSYVTQVYNRIWQPISIAENSAPYSKDTETTSYSGGSSDTSYSGDYSWWWGSSSAWSFQGSKFSGPIWTAEQMRQMVAQYWPRNTEIEMGQCLVDKSMNFDLNCVQDSINFASRGSSGNQTSRNPVWLWWQFGSSTQQLGINTQNMEQMMAKQIAALLTPMITKMFCPTYYINNSSVGTPFLFRNILSSMKKDTYDKIDLRDNTSSIKVRVAEEMNETLWLDKAQIIKINHPEDTEVVMSSNWVPLVFKEAHKVDFNKKISGDRAIINLPLFEQDASLIIEWWITGKNKLQKLKSDVIGILPKNFKGPIYDIIESSPLLSSALIQIVKNYEGIKLEECQDTNCNEVNTIFMYVNWKKAIELEAWKHYRLSFDPEIIDVTGLYTPIQVTNWQIEVLRQKDVALQSTDNNNKVLNKWDFIDLNFHNEALGSGISTYFLNANWYYHTWGE